MRASLKTNQRRFKNYFGSTPYVCTLIWEDLQTTEILEARVEKKDINIEHFLMAMHFLKTYPKEYEREVAFDVSEKYGREKTWMWVEKIRGLKAEKVVWADYPGQTWVITVDGAHFWINEPMTKSWKEAKKYYSHKFNKAGWAYELGISISEDCLVWMNGPFPAGKNDTWIFQQGLKALLISKNQKAIGDGVYSGHQEAVSTWNAHDSKRVRKFKSRALKRHEKFNGHMKVFECLSNRFRSGKEKFAACFEAVAVICQYQIENDKPMFDVLIEDILT